MAVNLQDESAVPSVQVQPPPVDKGPIRLAHGPRFTGRALATGTLAPLALPGGAPPGTAKGVTTAVGQPVVLDGSGQYAQVVRRYDAGKETSVITLTDKTGSHVLEPDPHGRLLDVCVSPASNYLAVETAAPQYAGFQYPVRPEPSLMRTDLVDLKTGTVLKSVPGFLPSWCG